MPFIIAGVLGVEAHDVRVVRQGTLAPGGSPHVICPSCHGSEVVVAENVGDGRSGLVRKHRSGEFCDGLVSLRSVRQRETNRNEEAGANDDGLFHRFLG